MSKASLTIIPIYLRDMKARGEFMSWLFRQPISWTNKRRTAALWADLNDFPWREKELFEMGCLNPDEPHYV